MVRYDIWNLEIPDTVEDHMWDRHQLTAELVDSVLDGPHIVIRNRSNRAGTLLLIVRDRRNVCLSVPIMATDVAGSWRAVTAWPCKPRELAELRRRG
jgi:hypothetical protein